ncbi:MAG: dTMP kinase [Kiritimatiellia bacterium]|jgi:dTMP kinase
MNTADELFDWPDAPTVERGKFITLEGPEGSGKSTQGDILVKRLRDEGLDVVFTREPGGTPTGEMIRDILQHDKAGEPVSPEAEVLLFAASRAQHVEHVIEPALANGSWVICDRFIDSTTAYQGYGRDIPIKQLKQINHFAIGPTVPNLTLLFDIDVDVAFSRIQKHFEVHGGEADRIEQESRAFHERVRNGYLELSAEEPRRFRLVHAERSPDEIAAEIWNLITELRA